MKEKINIAELLKDCPRGMELYSPLCGKCVFDRINMGTIICKKQNSQDITFTSKGYYMLPVFDDCECMIFPSKDQRDWSKFHRPFKDGDILAYDNMFAPATIFIYRYSNDRYNTSYFAALSGLTGHFFKDSTGVLDGYNPNVRFATKEEKLRLFIAIKANGYKWNDETKTLEKLKKDKFDITTLKPFESKILVRDATHQRWEGAIFGRYNDVTFITIGGLSWLYCIPYEGNEHLLGTTDDCDDYYKTWE